MKAGFKVWDADTHVEPSAEVIDRYLDPEFRERIPELKQFRVPTANSQPRAIANGSDGNRWFTEGTEFLNAPARIGRVTPAGNVAEFAPDAATGCNSCILSDIAQGPNAILYVTSNDPTLIRFDVTTQSFDRWPDGAFRFLK